MSDTGAITVSAEQLASALSRVLHAAAKEEARPILNGVMLEGDDPDRLYVVAADNYRLARATIQITANEAPLANWGRVVIRLEDVTTLLALLRNERSIPVELRYEPGTPGRGPKLLVTGHQQLTIRCVDGDYPQYGKVYTQDVTAPRFLTINGKHVLEALTAAGTRAHAVHMVVGGPLELLRFESPDYLEVVGPVRGTTALLESDMRPAPAWEEPLRRMLDGSPCWCVSAEKPHEGWVHAPLCTERREFIWRCAQDFNPFGGIAAALGQAPVAAEFPVGSVWRDNDPRGGKTFTVTGANRTHVYIKRENGRAGKILTRRMRRSGASGYSQVT